MDLMWVLDVDGKYTYFNKRAEELAGYSLKNMKGKSFKQFIEKKDISKVMGVFRKALGGRTQKYEVSAKGKNGSVFVLSVNTAPIYSQGKIIGTVSFGEDITDKKKSEEELKSTKQMMENIAEGITDSVYLLSLDRRILWANSAALKLTGLSNTELLGMHCYEATYNRNRPCAPPDAPCAVAKVLKTNAPASTIHKCCDKKGNVQYAELFVYPVRNGKGKIIQFVHTIRDITDRKKIEDIIKENERRYRTLFEGSMFSLWEEDLSEVKKFIDRLKASGVGDLRLHFKNNPEDVEKCARMVSIIDVNKATIDFYGAANKKDFIISVGKSFLRNPHRTFEEEILAMADGRGVFEAETRTKTINGAEKYVLMKVSLAEGCEKSWSRAIISVIDISERKRNEKELKAINAELHAKIEDLEKFNKIAIGRELRMIGLKKRISELESKKRELK